MVRVRPKIRLSMGRFQKRLIRDFGEPKGISYATLENQKGFSISAVAADRKAMPWRHFDEGEGFSKRRIKR